MPTQNGDQFVEAVRPALEALLSDLQLTTEVLRKASQRNIEDTQSMNRLETSQRSRSSSRQNINHDQDIDPIYQEQHLRTIRESKSATPRHGLDNLEQLLNDYSDKRRSKTEPDHRESSVASNSRVHLDDTKR
uniref:GIT domain-containing protein n=1 Tax=Parastrongyloides trichosuri TaxID=131310 RepID=A0A0N4ZNZ7_PARTI